MRKYFLIIFGVIFLFVSCKEQTPLPPPSSQKQYISFSSPAELHDYFAWAPGRAPLIAAHRGGPMPGFPENCIETFDNVLVYAPCIIECDVRESKDGILIMMHDETLDRTTTAQGNVHDYTWEELKTFYLKDNDGKPTKFRIPSLDDVLKWGRSKAIIELDVKRGINPQNVNDAISRNNATAYTVVITYTMNMALNYHRLNPDLVISVSARGVEGTRLLLNSDIPKQNIIAFTGVFEPPKEVYSMLHKNGIRAILGTLGNLDQRAEARGIQVYLDILKNGADILATDNVPMVAQAVEQFLEMKK